MSLSIAANASDVQVNAPDHNAPNLDNLTTESETNVAASGSLVVVGYNSSRQAGQLGTGAWTSLSGFAYSTDTGATFTDGGFVLGGANQLTGDPALAFNRTGSTLYYASIGSDATGASRIFVNPTTSLSPVTFGAPVMISGIVGGGFQDKEFLAVDTTGGAHDGNVYVAWTEFAGAGAQIVFASAPSSLAFSPTIALSPSTGLNQGAMPAVAANGDVYVTWGFFTSTSAPGPQTVYIARSSNGGASFGAPVSVANVTSTDGNMASGGINIRTRGFPYIAIDRTQLGSPTRGNIYIVFQAKPASASRSAIFFVRSKDQGATWSAPREISGGPAVTLNGDATQNDNWQPSIAVSPANGHIRVTFYSRREDASNTDIRVYDAGSTDGGQTWFNQPRSTVAFRPSTGYDPLIVSTYMGDYIHVVANGSNYHAAWGDTRNACTPPGAATAPCSPVGRGDQDVMSSSDADPAGADLAITPWGYVTGDGPLWQSPDIYVVDGSGTVVNAKKLIVNRLRARVRNLGNAAANGVTVRLRFAPIFVGLADSDFEQIAAPIVNFSAAGGATDLQEVPVNWDLTNTADTNGGLWPLPISAFDHFCVRAAAEFSGDVNLSNNGAQTNFVDVADACCGPLRFLVGNPFERPIVAVLVIDSLPKGYSVRVRETPQGEPIKLRPREIRVATLQVTRPQGYERERRTHDVVASVSMQVDGNPIGGLSLLVARANVRHDAGVRARAPLAQLRAEAARGASQPVMPAALPSTNASLSVRAAPAVVASTIARVLQQRRISVVQVDPTHGLVSSGSIPLNADALRAAVAPSAIANLPPEAVGRYLVSFKANEGPQGSTQLIVSVRIIVQGNDLDSPIGGRVVPSNGSLEKQQLASVMQTLQNLR